MSRRAELKLSSSMEDYIRAVYDLHHEEGVATTTALARRLGVAPASVTGMLKRLSALGLVEHEPYGGVELTAPGERVALEIVRHHRLIETYLAEAMGVSWDEVHQEADRLEHHISDALGDRMAEILGHPERDPHGAPIPPKEGPFVQPRYRTLATAAAGDRLVIREVVDEDAERLRYLDSLGMRPDVCVEVIAVAPFGGPITVQVAETTHAIGLELAATVFVEREC
ncbi:MAG: metal-dependent transcriptional regulator [Anaerolineae bacterium]